jgi:hypothetical protein
LTIFHNERVRQLATIIAGETWIQCDVPQEFQSFADAIVHGSIQPLTPSIIHSKTEEQTSDTSSTTANKEAPISLKQIVVHERSFYTVGAALLTLKILSEYLECAKRILMIADDIANASVG